MWLALTDGQITWNATHVLDGHGAWALRSDDFKRKTTRTLIRASNTRTERWFPNLDDRRRLVCGAVACGSDPQVPAAHFHAYLAVLADNMPAAGAGHL